MPRGWKKYEEFARKLERVGETEWSFLQGLLAAIEYYQGTPCDYIYEWATPECERFWEYSVRPALENIVEYFTKLALDYARKTYGKRFRPVYERILNYIAMRFSEYFATPEGTESLAKMLENIRHYGYRRLAKMFIDMWKNDPNIPSLSINTWRTALTLAKWRRWFLE